MDQIESETFNNLKERMKAKFSILLEGYLRDAKTYLVGIESNLPSGDIKEIIGSAHSLKSASGLLGLKYVHDYAEKIEYAAKGLQENNSNNLESLRKDYEGLQESFSSIEGYLLTEMEKAKAV